ncbi:MAG: hypothetical protein JW832_08280 [Deltaproteobacteria bacterium]|nr:hypothetical protein [Deltaproteobacteria bacterium]
MEKRGVVKTVFLTLVLAMGLAGTAQAGALLTLDPGESTIREFTLYEEFDARKLGPMETFLVIGMGDNETNKLGDLTITLKPSVTKDFGTVLEYSLIGLAYPLGGKPEFINVKSAAPLSITKTVKMSAAYGLVLVGAYIKTIDGDALLPAQFSITFNWAVAK